VTKANAVAVDPRRMRQWQHDVARRTIDVASTTIVQRMTRAGTLMR
jgi:hypothetical protein